MSRKEDGRVISTIHSPGTRSYPEPLVVKHHASRHRIDYFQRPLYQLLTHLDHGLVIVPPRETEQLEMSPSRRNHGKDLRALDQRPSFTNPRLPSIHLIMLLPSCHALSYRHIVFDTRHAMLFINLFHKISTKDKQKFLESDLLDSSTHLIDKPLAARLRWFMSYTKSLTLITREDMRLRYPKDHQRLGGYNVIQDLQGTKQNQNKLWPSIDYCHIDLTAWPYHSDANKGGQSSPDKYFIPETSPLVESLFYKLHPKNMKIIVPDRLIDDGDTDKETGETFWWTCIQGLHAENIELAGLQSAGVLQHFPQADKSLSIRFDRPPHRDLGYVEDLEYRRLNRIKKRAVHILSNENREPLWHIDSLRLIGLIRSDEYAAADSDKRPELKVMIGVPVVVAGLMRERMVAGNMRDFRLAIMPDTSPESEAEAVWHTFKVPEVE